MPRQKVSGPGKKLAYLQPVEWGGVRPRKIQKVNAGSPPLCFLTRYFVLVCMAQGLGASGHRSESTWGKEGVYL